MTDKSERTPTRQDILDRVRKAQATLPERDFLFPLYVIIEPTNVCNLRCSMCPSKDQSRERGVMDMDLWRKIIDEIAEKSPQTVVWPAIMGESLTLGERFVEMLRYARGKGLTVILNTNAVLFDDALIAAVAALGLKEIIVGLDATTAEAYDKIRVGGDFARAVANTEKLIRACAGRTVVTAQFIEQEHNASQREEFKKFWLARGARVKIRPRLGWGDGVEAPDLLLEQKDRPGPCPWLVRTVSIHWNGVAVQCDGDWDQKNPAGDLTEQSLEDIWKGELARRRRLHREGDFDFDPCRSCCDWQAGLSEITDPAPEGDEA